MMLIAWPCDNWRTGLRVAQLYLIDLIEPDGRFHSLSFLFQPHMMLHRRLRFDITIQLRCPNRCRRKVMNDRNPPAQTIFNIRDHAFSIQLQSRKSLLLPWQTLLYLWFPSQSIRTISLDLSTIDHLLIKVLNTFPLLLIRRLMDLVLHSICLPLLHDGLPMILINWCRRNVPDAMPSIIRSHSVRLATGNYASHAQAKDNDDHAISVFYAHFILSDCFSTFMDTFASSNLCTDNPLLVHCTLAILWSIAPRTELFWLEMSNNTLFWLTMRFICCSLFQA